VLWGRGGADDGGDEHGQTAHKGEDLVAPVASDRGKMFREKGKSDLGGEGVVNLNSGLANVIKNGPIIT